MNSNLFTNVSHHLTLRAQTHPHNLAIIDPANNTTKTYSELEQISNQYALKFQKLDIQKNSKTLLLLKPSTELLAVVFALFKIGAIPIIIDPGMGMKNFLNCVKTSQPDSLIAHTIPSILSHLFFRTFRHLKTRIFIRKSNSLPIPTKSKKIENHFDPISTQPTDIAAILFTSGSTGKPKGVCYTHQIFNAQLSIIQNRYQIQPGEVDLPMLPIFALFNPALGLTTVIPEMNPSRPAKVNPKKIVDSILNYHITNSFGSPVLWKIIANYCEINQITLPSLKRILMAGCSVPPNLIFRYQKIAANATIHTPYGATEALPISSLSSKEIIENNLHTKIHQGTCIGKPINNCEIQIIKITDDPLLRLSNSLKVNPGEVGEIIVKGPVVTSEYLHLPKATLHSKIYENSSWHRMGDLGFIDSQGFLWFCGRKIERVQTSKTTFYTDLIENIINQHPSVNRSALISHTTNNKNKEIVPAIVIEPHSWPKSKNAKEKLLNDITIFAKTHPNTAPIHHFFLYKKFPVDTRHNAKIHRLALSKHFNRNLGSK